MTSGGTRGGGLGDLENLSVASATAAAAALDTIEDLIQTSIDAAAAFGSSEKRLSIQAEFVTSLDMTPLMFLMLTQLIIFLLGWPLEWSEILIIFVPIFLPLLDVFGINPYFFAMLIALNLQTSFLTPPMAMSAYYLKGVLKKQIELMEIFRGIMPYLGIVILTMCLMYIFPGIALWFPDYLFGPYIP